MPFAEVCLIPRFLQAQTPERFLTHKEGGFHLCIRRDYLGPITKHGITFKKQLKSKLS